MEGLHLQGVEVPVAGILLAHYPTILEEIGENG